MGTTIARVVFKVSVVFFILLCVVLGAAQLGMPIFGDRLQHSLGETFSLAFALLAVFLALSHSLRKDAHK